MATAIHTTTDTPCIYVACLATYNNGILHGCWIDAAQEPWDIYDEVKAMLAASPAPGAEEWAIHDYEGFGGVRIEEFASFESIAELAAFIGEHGDLGAALLDHFGGDINEAREAMTDRYLGCYAKLTDYMEEATEQIIAIPRQLAFYIDYDAMARDAEMSGDLFAIEIAHDEVHVFAGC